MRRTFKIYLSLFLFAFTALYAQESKKQLKITVQSTVQNENGNPIKGATVYAQSGRTTKTNNLGEFSINTLPGTVLLIESDGYKSITVSSDNLTDKISMQTSSFLLGEKDNVNMGFITAKQGDVIFDVTQVKPADFLTYDATTNLTDAINGRVAGIINSNNIRGYGNALLVIDGNPSNLTFSESTLSLQEIESITVMKDVNASVLYGTQARNGVVVITTKRGEANKRKFNVIANFGIEVPKAWPKYLGSADYMTLYNEARNNDGLLPLYDEATIENYRSGNKYRYPDVDYYSSEYLRKYAKSSRVMTEFSGGNKKATYYANLEWTNTGNFINFGEVANMSNNQLKARANVDFAITDFIKNSVNTSTVMDFNKGGVSNYLSSASTTIPNRFSPLVPFDLMDNLNPAIKDMLDSRKNDLNGKYLYGGNSQNQTNPFADNYVGGYKQTLRQVLQFNNRVDVDLNKLTKGLTLVANIGFDFSNQFDQAVNNEYSVYEPVWSDTSDSIVGLNKYGADIRSGVQNLSNHYLYRRISYYAQANYVRSFNNHNVNASLLVSGDIFSTGDKESVQPDKNAHLGMYLAYDFKHTYYAVFSSAYSNSVKLAEGNRGGFSPTLALGWTLSNEKFLKDSKWIDLLKIRTSAGILKSDMTIGGYYYYENIYDQNSSFTWNEGLSSNGLTKAKFGQNPYLTFENRKELNFGFESILFQKSLHIDANYFNTRVSDKVTRLNNQFPSYYSEYVPYGNNDVDGYTGVELGIDYTKKYKNFSFMVGGYGLYKETKAIKRDEVWSEDYLYRQGRSLDAMFALESLGLFSDLSEIEDSPLQTFGPVKPGDIKYKDQNGDGIINNNDKVQIGRSDNPLIVGLNLNMSYKRFSLFVSGQGFFGSDVQLTGNYYRMSGNDKYSVIALERWTEETKNTAKYPRLTSLAGDNNNQGSTFWLYNDSYFSLSRVQLTYEISEKVCHALALNKLSFYVRGSNLAVLSERTDVRNLSVGGDPKSRVYFLGINASF